MAALPAHPNARPKFAKRTADSKTDDLIGVIFGECVTTLRFSGYCWNITSRSLEKTGCLIDPGLDFLKIRALERPAVSRLSLLKVCQNTCESQEYVHLRSCSVTLVAASMVHCAQRALAPFVVHVSLRSDFRARLPDAVLQGTILGDQQRALLLCGIQRIARAHQRGRPTRVFGTRDAQALPRQVGKQHAWLACRALPGRSVCWRVCCAQVLPRQVCEQHARLAWERAAGRSVCSACRRTLARPARALAWRVCKQQPLLAGGRCSGFCALPGLMVRCAAAQKLRGTGVGCCGVSAGGRHGDAAALSEASTR